MEASLRAWLAEILLLLSPFRHFIPPRDVGRDRIARVAGCAGAAWLCVHDSNSHPTLLPIVCEATHIIAMPFGASHKPLVALANSAICSFFSQIEVFGSENVPAQGPIILSFEPHATWR